ncbi:hypothetical protein GBAR_LOCUS13491 [Geodia barretti]|uniref:Uncharacterized protein n=1 Tax=Geodia barretti TaxID=519541 RepID=A0AA35WQL8_GEOBA|nr:hypothetical protein GBAR_LOCUS13491 [Geodia barretti]
MMTAISFILHGLLHVPGKDIPSIHAIVPEITMTILLRKDVTLTILSIIAALHQVKGVACTVPLPPPPPPALQRKERIIRHVRRSPLPRSPPPHTSSRSVYSHRPPSPPSRYPLHRHSHRPYRRSYSPPPPSVHSRDARLRREVISDHIQSRPSRDMRSLCGPPIHVRDRPHNRSPDRRLLRPPPRRPSYSSISRNSLRTRRLDIGRRRDVRPPIRSGVESGITRRNASMSDRAEPKRKDKELSAEKNEKDKTSSDEQGSSGPPSLTSPTTAQLLWDEQEIKLENEKEEGTVEGREEGEVEELDYDESMEDLDLHPVGNIDEGGGGEARKLSTKQDERQGTVNWDDPQGDEVVDRASSIDDENLLDTETEEQTIATEIGGDEEASGDGEDKGDVHISSPIRVSPHRKKSRIKCSPRQKEQGKDETKLSVKERLYVSKNAIGNAFTPATCP